ncbi:translation initiation factor 2 [Kluyveromyces lactis]|uniref:Translation initiation factor IF-2, mitochondrial n=1 Tax=Kluyveromyces lactis (strain ATCC 8585 / CBS 2359 / DSM 70799 / NBRC 1267 / NRRL Y-1140 / WM37) TaxID=284590 RepID=Q6CX64_KLULA|nr:uncharacterized protein KLLA0_A10923g [Kluyveromyces lactis]CAH03063.1 KLLA0A10923p [Kluyveromyces lactis]|eukprot:XP_451475.1 uncharacterized protein KLLA0_A10923g [Kluyveromyces lactis]
MKPMLSTVPLRPCCRLTSRLPLLTRSIHISGINLAGKHKKRSFPSKELKKLTFDIPNHTSVNNLSNLLNVRLEKLIQDLKKLGFTHASSNYILTKGYIELILQEYNYDFEVNEVVNSSNVYDELKSPMNPRFLETRPPIVTIMGHVDHGKTTILDYLRKSSIVSQEHGGITQHIGAFQCVAPISRKLITFLDTPGHAAFLKMRERGANITDIIVLVVSVEDSIMPQTLEAIKHAKNSGNELIVAITKIDRISNLKERAEAIEKVENSLIVNDIELEKIGGDVQVVHISAKTGENMDQLEESIISLSDIMDLKAEKNVKTVCEGWVLESEVKKAVGNVATVLLKKGVMNKGDILISGNSICKVRAMLNEHGAQVTKALPSQAVEIVGWKSLPNAGDEVIQAKSESIAKKYVARRQHLLQEEKEAETVEKLNDERVAQSETKALKNDIDEVDEDEEQAEVESGPKDVNFIIKADVSGSVEAIVQSIEHLGNDEVKCNIVGSSVGVPAENDLKMAKITGSTILCFNLDNVPNDIINNKDKIPVKQFNVIYKLIEDVTETLTDNLKPIFEEKQIAAVEIREIFEFKVKRNFIKIAGCKVINGKVSRNSLVKVIRGPEEEVIYKGRISTIKQGKETVQDVNKGNECGITLENDFEGYQAGDKLIVYESVKIPRFL